MPDYPGFMLINYEGVTAQWHTAAFHILLIHNGINTVYGQDTQSGALDKVPSENRAPNV